MTEFLRITNWSRYQHYKNRNPPWIKLHVQLLQSPEWVSLSESGRLLALVCMMIAPRFGGKIPNDAKYLQGVGLFKRKPNLTELISCGFLEKPLANASLALAEFSDSVSVSDSETVIESGYIQEGKILSGESPKSDEPQKSNVVYHPKTRAAE
mgnify:CR=1 FL=1